LPDFHFLEVYFESFRRNLPMNNIPKLSTLTRFKMKINISERFFFQAICVAMFFFCFLEGNLFGASAKFHIDVGLNHFYKKRYLEAFREFKNALEIDPQSSDAHFNLGRVYKIQGFLKEAAVEFQLAVACDPRNSAAQRELAELKNFIQSDVQTRLKIQGQDEALKQRLTDSTGGAFQRRGEEFLKKGDVSRAIIEFEQAVKTDPYNPNLYKLLGALYFRLNRFGDSLNAYTNAQKYAPADAEIFYAQGLVHLRTQNREEALNLLKKAVELSPKMVKAHFGLGEAYEALGQNEDALFEYKKCLELNPNLSQAKEKIQDISSKVGYSYFSKGTSYYHQGDFEKAQALLSLAKKYGSLNRDQLQQAEEMLTSANYWIGKKRAEEKEKSDRQEVSQSSYVNKNISVEDVVRNPQAYIGEAVEWHGVAICSDTDSNRPKFFVNTNPNADTNSNLDFSFGIVFPKKLPNDPRISDYSQVKVKGKIVGTEKILNSFTNVFSSQKQPIIEATEVTFIRENYEEPLIIRYY